MTAGNPYRRGAATFAVLAGVLIGALGAAEAGMAGRCQRYQCGGEIEPEPPPHPPAPKPDRPDKRRPLVVSMGDSYASGEGAPDTPAADVFTPARWKDAACHRSDNAPVSRAVRRLRAANPYAQGIDAIDVSCSGATIAGRVTGGHDADTLDGGLLDAQAGAGKPPQVDQVDAAVGGRTVDALMVSTGGNDLRFATVVRSCGSTVWNCADPAGPTQRNVDADLAALPRLYERLVDAVQGDASGGGRRLRADVRDVYLMEYPDPTVGDRNCRCHHSPFWDYFNGITSAENEWARHRVLDPLNAAIRQAVVTANARPGRHPRWHSIPAPDFAGHGYCAAQPWIHTLTGSLGVQLDRRGAMHPNYQGTEVIGRTVYDRLAYLVS